MPYYHKTSQTRPPLLRIFRMQKKPFDIGDHIIEVWSRITQLVVFVHGYTDVKVVNVIMVVTFWDQHYSVMLCLQ